MLTTRYAGSDTATTLEWRPRARVKYSEWAWIELVKDVLEVNSNLIVLEEFKNECRQCTVDTNKQIKADENYIRCTGHREQVRGWIH